MYYPIRLFLLSLWAYSCILFSSAYHLCLYYVLTLSYSFVSAISLDLFVYTTFFSLSFMFILFPYTILFVCFCYLFGPIRLYDFLQLIIYVYNYVLIILFVCFCADAIMGLCYYAIMLFACSLLCYYAIRMLLCYSPVRYYAIMLFICYYAIRLFACFCYLFGPIRCSAYDFCVYDLIVLNK